MMCHPFEKEMVHTVPGFNQCSTYFPEIATSLMKEGGEQSVLWGI